MKILLDATIRVSDRAVSVRIALMTTPMARR